MTTTFLGIEDLIGTIEEGKRAELILLSANPLDDISNSRKIEGVVLRGQWLDRARLDSLLSDSEEQEASTR